MAPTEYTPASIKSDGHVLLTGPVQGTVTLDDGTVVDVTQPVIAVSDDNAAEIAEKIGLRLVEEGHPDDVEYDEEAGEMVQRDFVYVAPEEVPQVLGLSEADLTPDPSTTEKKD